MIFRPKILFIIHMPRSCVAIVLHDGPSYRIWVAAFSKDMGGEAGLSKWIQRLELVSSYRRISPPEPIFPNIFSNHVVAEWKAAWKFAMGILLGAVWHTAQVFNVIMYTRFPHLVGKMILFADLINRAMHFIPGDFSRQPPSPQFH